MDMSVLAESIITKIKRFSTSGIADFIDNSIVDTFSEVDRLYKQAYMKAYTLAVPKKTRFRFIKRIINKLIRVNVYQQVEYNYKILEIIKSQQNIIVTQQKLLFTLSQYDISLLLK